MIEVRCPCCGGKVLLPDGPPKTAAEKRAFSKEWDARVKVSPTDTQ